MATRCEYREGSRRCSRNGFSDPPLCRPHALQASLEGQDVHLDEGSPFFNWLDAADRILARSNNEIAQQIRGVFGEFLADSAHRQTDNRPPSPPPPEAKPVGEDPRVVLGFEPGDRLTPEIIRARKRELAAIFHPDKPCGSEAAMKRVNEAADKLLCSP